MFCKNGVLRNFAKFTGKHLCQSLFLNKVAGLCEISKNIFYYRTRLVAASERGKNDKVNVIMKNQNDYIHLLTTYHQDQHVDCYL